MMNRFTVSIVIAILTTISARGGEGYRQAVERDRKEPRVEKDAWTGMHPLEHLYEAPVALIPYPAKVVWKREVVCKIPGKLAFSDGGATDAGRLLHEVLEPYGISLTKAESSAAFVTIAVEGNKSDDPEGYAIDVDSSGVRITGNSAAGAFYAVQTLRQMVSGSAGAAVLPGVSIQDRPAFPVRGFMHDTGRNFQTIESIKRQLDHFAAYKLNAFHWHLTDNPAWRVESRIYPKLNDPKYRSPLRDPEGTYTFGEIRDVIDYAKKLHIRIIPELDMPGHSRYFQRVFGFKMESAEGMEVLEKLIDEFCQEIPGSDCPTIHLGGDEVHVPNPGEFIGRMTARLAKHGRAAILWNPGLQPAAEDTVVQIWGDESARRSHSGGTQPVIDSAGGYLNSFDPLRLPQRYFFWQPCGVPDHASDKRKLGGILCMWPDIRVADKNDIFRHSPVWPTLLAFSECVWQGRKSKAIHLMEQVPSRGSEAWLYLREFEARMAEHRRFFQNEAFPWIKQGTCDWQVCGPFPHDKGMMWDHSFEPETNPLAKSFATAAGDVQWKPVTGTTASISPTGKTPIPATYYFRTWIHSTEARSVDLWIGFQYVARSQRRSNGIPKQGCWDGGGASIWINGVTPAPPVWKNPGKWRFENPTWEQQPNEIPLTDEEQYWLREPVKVELKKGANLVLVRLPHTHKIQPLQVTCAPVKKSGTHWIEDESVVVSAVIPAR